jgi:flagellar biosynthesis/type III secretory pathway protein FliH
VAFDNGYKDGYDKGREDARDNDRYDPVRHQRYRSADHGYNGSYGSKEEYKPVYREGFVAGYEEGYRDTTDYDRDRRPGGVRLPWSF